MSTGHLQIKKHIFSQGEADSKVVIDRVVWVVVKSHGGRLLGYIAYGTGVILEYDATSKPVNALDLVYLLKLKQNGSDWTLDAAIKEGLQVFLIRKRPLGNSVSKAGQEILGLKKARPREKRVIKDTEGESLLLQEVWQRLQARWT